MRETPNCRAMRETVRGALGYLESLPAGSRPRESMLVSLRELVNAPDEICQNRQVDNPQNEAHAKMRQIAERLAGCLGLLALLCEERGLYPISTTQARTTLADARKLGIEP